MGPQNGIVGDTFATELPTTNVQEQDLQDEKRMAKFSRTKEFAILKSHLEERVSFYQTHLPDGRAITEVSEEERGRYWLVANVIIAEFNGVIQAYERAQEIVKSVG